MDSGSVRGKIFALSVSVLRIFSSSISGIHASVALKFSEIANYGAYVKGAKSVVNKDPSKDTK